MEKAYAVPLIMRSQDYCPAFSRKPGERCFSALRCLNWLARRATMGPGVGQLEAARHVTWERTARRGAPYPRGGAAPGGNRSKTVEQKALARAMSLTGIILRLA